VLRRCALIVIITAIILMGAQAHTASANGLGIRPEPVLEPIGGRGGIKLSAFSADAHISCADGMCSLTMEQIYWLNNPSTAAVTLEFGLPAALSSWLPEQPAVSLNGAALSPTSASDDYSAVWQITLQSDQHAALVLTYQHSFGSSLVLATAVELDSLVNSWGLPEGARVRFVLAETVGDDAVLWMVPFISRFDGRQIIWDYEVPSELIIHQFVLLRPDTWQELQQSMANQDYGRLASLYMQIDQALMELALPQRNYFGQAVAAYHAAIASDPQNDALYIGLARAYHNRAELLPTESLNYALLAAQLLEQAQALSPDNSEVSQELANTYYAIAVASAEQGNQETALLYLSRLLSEDLPHAESEQDLRTLALRWSVELAEQGNNGIAYEQAQALLPPTTLQLLDDYAPPLTGLETMVTTDPGSRQVSYRIQLYAGTAEIAKTQIDALAVQLRGIMSLDVITITEGTHYDLTLVLRYNTLSEMQQRAAEIRSVMSQDTSILMHLMRVPWDNAPEALRQESGMFRRDTLYREVFDSSKVQPVWDEQSQYSNWRLVETTNPVEGGEMAQLQVRLTTYLLKQQQQVWRQLPASCSWIYRLQMETGSEPQEWILSFGESRILAIDQTIYNEPLLHRLAFISAAVFLLAVIAILVPWSALPKPRG